MEKIEQFLLGLWSKIENQINEVLLFAGFGGWFIYALQGISLWSYQNCAPGGVKQQKSIRRHF
jgi:predicted Rdx family selenoprotein